MHFELANKEKKRISVKIPLILLAIWMAGSTGYWVCEVKGLCESGSVLDKPSSTLIDK
ncbi:MAG: hypothetical protein GXP23_08880 [Gammaproteobacteria bacterium]|nr:hypothetical protein [Gammaproteobacteria bacterium]